MKANVFWVIKLDLLLNWVSHVINNCVFGNVSEPVSFFHLGDKIIHYFGEWVKCAWSET